MTKDKIQINLQAEKCGSVSGPITIIFEFVTKEPFHILLTPENLEETKKEEKILAYGEPITKNQCALTFINPIFENGDNITLVGDLSKTFPSKNLMEIKEEKGEKGENCLKIFQNGEHITSLYYNQFNIANRPYLYPLIAPCGIGLTRNYPMKKGIDGEKQDHIHHTGVWTAWGNINGVDNWAFGDKKGKQVVTGVNYKVNDVFAEIDLSIDWTTPDKSNVQLQEMRTIRIYNASHLRIIDFTICLRAINKNIKFKDTKEGGFLSVRVPSSMDVPVGGKIENSNGKICIKDSNERDVWGAKATWCDYCGTIPDKNTEKHAKKVGVAILDHNNNPNHPTYWHVRKYGLMTANPFGKSYFVPGIMSKIRKGHYKLEKGQMVKFNYRLIAHDGDAQDAHIDIHYKRYLNHLKTDLHYI